MNKKELKEALTPIVKECIKEVLLEEGILSKVVSEVALGLNVGQSVVTETFEPPLTRPPPPPAPDHEKERQAMREQMNATRKGLMDAIGRDAYGGIDLFEGTSPAPADTGGPSQSPLSGQDPNDPGVDIGALFNSKGAVWNKLK
tara:strand:- start:365 stop:796 length:432 start_codon:yes stop_codon:yes gene_type:complete